MLEGGIMATIRARPGRAVFRNQTRSNNAIATTELDSVERCFMARIQSPAETPEPRRARAASTCEPPASRIRRFLRATIRSASQPRSLPPGLQSSWQLAVGRSETKLGARNLFFRILTASQPYSLTVSQSLSLSVSQSLSAATPRPFSTRNPRCGCKGRICPGAAASPRRK